jgi:hypothetical protein
MPECLAQADEAELGVAGYLAKRPAALDDVDLQPRDFNDPVCAGIIECLQAGGDPHLLFDNLPAPCEAHQFRRLAKAVHEIGSFWRIQTALQRAETAQANMEPPEIIFIDLVEEVIDDVPLEAWPAGDPKDVIPAVLAAHRQRLGVAVKPLAGRVAAR